MFLKKYVVAVALCVTTMAFGVASNASGKSQPKVAGGEYQIGFTDGLTGVLAGVTTPELDSVKAAFNAVNSAGGINGHLINLISLDQGAPGSGEATSNVIELATADHVSAILGMLISNDCSSVTTTVAQYQVPLLCQHAAPTNLNPVEPFVYVSNDIETQEIPSQIALLPKLTTGKRPVVDILTNDNIGADNWANALRAKLAAKGAKVKNVINMSESATSIAPYVSKIIADKPAIVYMEIFAAFEPQLVTALQNAHLDPPIVATLGDVNWTSYKAYPNMYGIYIATPLQPGTPGQTKQQLALIKAYAALGVKGAANLNAGEGSANLMGPEMVIQALRACGYPCDATQMAAKLNQQHNLVVPGVDATGTFGYTGGNHAGARAYTYWHWSKAAHRLVQFGPKFKAGTVG